MNALEVAEILRRYNALNAPLADAYEPQAVGYNAFQIGLDGPTRAASAEPPTFWDKLGELGRLWYDRLIGEPISAMGRIGGAIRGEQTYGPIDEVNLPRVVAQKQAQDVLEALGLYSGPSILAGKPAANVLSVFGGVRAKKAPLFSQEVAERALAAGKPKEEVWQHTGWMLGKDGKWRFEIDDSAAKIYGPKDAKTMGEIAKAVNSRVNHLETPSLRHYLKHDELFAQYPELQDVRVSVVPRDASKLEGARGAFSENSNVIYIADDLSPSEAIRTMLHEIQHWVQKKEGFSRGGKADTNMWLSQDMRPELLKEAKRIFDEWKPASYSEFWGSEDVVPEGIRAYKAYLKEFNSPKASRERWLAAQEAAPMRIYGRLHGEQEARNTAERFLLNAFGRAENYPLFSDDIVVRMK